MNLYTWSMSAHVDLEYSAWQLTTQYVAVTLSLPSGSPVKWHCQVATTSQFACDIIFIWLYHVHLWFLWAALFDWPTSAVRQMTHIGYGYRFGRFCHLGREEDGGHRYSTTRKRHLELGQCGLPMLFAHQVSGGPKCDRNFQHLYLCNAISICFQWYLCQLWPPRIPLGNTSWLTYRSCEAVLSLVLMFAEVLLFLSWQQCDCDGQSSAVVGCVLSYYFLPCTSL